MSQSESGGFDPGRYLTKLKGNDYLEVKWRLLWVRTDHPDARIETECVSFNETFAVFKARVEIPNGGSATGWGSEEKGHFQDYIEKAETKAIGRALGALGYGTQFADDFADGDSGRIADAPVQRPRPMPNANLNAQEFRDGIVQASKDKAADTPERRKSGLAAVFAVGTDRGLSNGDIKAIAYWQHKVNSMTELTAPQLSETWKYLNENSPDTLKSMAESLAEEALSALRD